MAREEQQITDEHLRNRLILETLHQAARLFSDTKVEMDVYPILKNVINKILPGAYFTISRLQADDMTYRIIENSDLNKFIKSAIAITGKDLSEMDFPFDNLTDLQLQSINDRKLLHFSEGIYELVNGQFNKTVCKSIEKILNIKEVLSISLNVDNKYFGGIAFFIPESVIKSGYLNDMTELAIETISNQASAVIQRLRDRAALKKNEEIILLTNLQLETLVENSSSGYLFEDESRKILKVNKAFSNLFNLSETEIIIGLDCKEACLMLSNLFVESGNFVNEVEKFFSENKPVFNQELTMLDGQVLERDFIPVKTDNLAGFLWQYRDITTRKKTEEELLISQTRFNQLVSQLNDIIWKANGDGTDVVDLNNSFEKIYGIPASEFSKNPNLWIEVVHPEDRKFAEDCYKELFQTGNTTAEYRIVRPDGKIIWLHDRTSIVYDKNGNPIQMGGIATDITERKFLEERLMIKDFALDASPTAINLSDLNGIVFYANDAYLKLWGYTDRSEIIGKHISDVSLFKDEVVQDIASILQGKNFISERRTRRKDGTDVICLISASLVKSRKGESICMMALFVDTTEQKQIELKLQEQTEQLKELNSTKDKFFSIIAHDLKGPFSSIMGFTDFLETEYAELSDNERLSYINLLSVSVNSTYKLLDNLLEWARLQRGNFEIKKENLNLKKIVDESIEAYNFNAAKKEIIVQIHIPEYLMVFADNYSVKTIVRNLFNNAIKYTSNGGSIEISAAKVESSVNIRITDNGVGMKPEKISKLFRIEESHSMPGTNEEKGSGLGLIICKELITKNDGTIQVESEYGKGTTFAFSLPLKQE